MDAVNNSLTVWDWIVISVYGMVMLGIGFYYSRKNKNAEDYMLGGREMKSWKVGISLFATMFSAITYLTIPGEIIKNGPMVYLMLTAMPFIYIVVAYYFIPFIMKLKVSSAYELLETKLGVQNRILASAFFLIMRLLWMSVIIYMVAEKIIIPILGWSEQAALLVSIVMGVITIIYTSVGGLRGVILTDVIQSFILFGGTILAIILIVNQLGSVSAIIPSQWPEHWAGWVFYDPNIRVSFLTAFIASFSWYVFTAGSDQMSIQRCLATRDVQEARRMYLSNLVVNAMVQLLLIVLGFSLFAYAKMNPEFIAGGKTILDSADSLFPRFIAHGFPVGISGLVLAGLLAAAMSSLSSGLNSSSLSIVNDFILRLSNAKMTEKEKIKFSTIISFLIGIVIVLLSLVIGNIKGNLLELAFKTVNLLVAPLFVPFFMAMFIRIAKPNATLIGTILSAVSAVLISYSSEILGVTISFLWIMPGAFLVGIVVSIGLSLLPYEKVRIINK